MANVEEITITDIIGKTGKYQILLYLICFHATGFFGTTPVTVELLAPKVKMYWNWEENNPNKTVFSSVHCSMQEVSDYRERSNISDIPVKLIYESDYSRNTLTEQLNMVCDKSWLASLLNSLCLLGIGFGSVLLRLSEKFGRKTIFILAAVLSIVSSLCMLFPQGYAMFAIAIFVFRGLTTQCGIIIFILAIEVTEPARAVYVGIILKSAFLFMQTVFVCVAWLLQDWFYTQLFQTILTLGYLPAFWYMMESPVWLAVRGRYEEAKENLVVLLRRNGRDLMEAEPKINLWLEQMQKRCEVETIAEKGKLTDLFKNKTITFYTCGLTFTITALNYIITALIYNAETFGSGMYIDLTVSNAFSVASVIVVLILQKKVSLRVIFTICSLLECLACIAFTITYSIGVARSVITILGRVFLAPVMALVMVYVNEVFPTSVRGVGTGFAVLISCLLTIASPFSKEMSEVTALYVPFILYAAFALASAVIFYLLPETKGQPMVHTVHDLKSRERSAGPVYTTST